jgi:hypothetical protein
MRKDLLWPGSVLSARPGAAGPSSAGYGPAVRAASVPEVMRAAQRFAVLGLLRRAVDARGIDLPDLQVHRPTLEEVYLQLTRGSR